jgi:hypothetical protein
MKEIGCIASDDIKIRSSHPISEDWEASGLTGLRMKLALDHHSEAYLIDSAHSTAMGGEGNGHRLQWGGGSMRPVRIALIAANEETDSVFCLVLCEERLHEMMAAPDPARAAERLWDHKAYSIVKLDCLYDDTNRLITDITEMRQLGLSDITALSSSLNQEPLVGLEEEREREMSRSLVTAAAQLPGTWLFPHLHVRKAPKAAAGLLNAASEIDSEKAKRSIHHWAMAASSGHDEEKELDQCISPHTFQLMDGHGVINTVTSRGRDSVLSQIAAAKKAYRKVEVQIVDLAVCSVYNAGFAHTRTYLHPLSSSPNGAEEREHVMSSGSHAFLPYQSFESMSVFLFDGEALIEDVWVLADPLPEQRQLMRKAVEPLSYKRSSIEWIP